MMRLMTGTVAAIIMLVFATIAHADEGLARCDDPASSGQFDTPCSLNWITHQTLHRLIWAPSADDYVVDIGRDADGSFQARSQRRPYLMDVDQDGWADLVFFTPIGMVNGNYDIYRFDPEQDTFVTMGQVNGSGFYLDKSGFVVADSRSSCCERGLGFYRINDEQLSLQFYMQVRPPELSDTIPQCQIDQSHDGADLATFRARYPDMIATYCNYYQDDGWQAIQARSFDHDTLSQTVPRAPAHTVFYCQLEGGTHDVTVTHQNGIYTYRYARIGQEAELEMQRDASDVTVLADNGAGTSRFGYIDFQNGDFTYQVYYAYEIILGADSADVSDTTRGLVVWRGDETDTVFDKKCLPKTSFDRIWGL